MKLKNAISALTSVCLLLGCAAAIPSSAANYSRASVHDPSIVKLQDGSYYIIGSHLGAARSNDLGNWTAAANSNLGSTNTTFFNNIYTDLAIPEKWSNTTNGYNLAGNMWAPDIIYNEAMGKYCMYLSVNGQVWNSSVVLCTADNIDGPYTYQGSIVYSGFTNKSVNNVNDTDVPRVLGSNPDISCYLSGDGSWNASYGTNAIDPAVFYDEEGDLWMVYGSWFGGLYMLELDETTGLRDYNVKYETIANVSDAYMGKKVAGGNYASGEGPYIEYMKAPGSNKGYYYLFVSYGFFNSNGGYNMRIFRSESPDGPYVDQNGNSAVFPRGGDNIGGTVGERLMSNYQWDCNNRPFKAQGHNSVLMDDDGKLFVIYHTKFDDPYGFHEVRVHQMIMNEDGWPTAAAYEYTGESLSEAGHTIEAVTGEYEFIFHTLNQAFVNEQSADVERSKNIVLHENGTITGDISGTWTMYDGSPEMTLTFGGVTYKGSFLVQADESAAMTQKMTFTATGNNTCVWGSKKEAYKASEDMVNLTNMDSSLVYNAESAGGYGETVKIGDTDLLSGVSYTITNKHSGMVLDLDGGNTTAGTNIQQWVKQGGSAQEWRIIAAENGYCKIVSMADEGKCIAVSENSAEDGLNVELQGYTGTDNQLWKLVQNGSHYGIVSKCSDDKSGLDVYDWSTENGGNINQWEYWGGDCQLWRIDAVHPMVNSGDYTIRNLNSGLFIADDNGNAVQSDAQTWTFTRLDDGTYTVQAADGRALTVENGSAEDGANIHLAAYTGDNSQKFTLQCSKDGSYSLLTGASGGSRCADVYEISLNAGGYILSGPEYYTLFDGATGEALDTVNYEYPRGEVSKSTWGDNYGNRCDRFLGAVMYCDGERPSAVSVRGYYTRMTAVAYDVVDKKLVKRWGYDTGYNWSAPGYGNGNHNAMPSDVDGDGKQELVLGATCIDDDGSVLWCNWLGHGDAMHLSDFLPDRAGQEVWVCHEHAPYGVSLLDAKDGSKIFHYDHSKDTGRCAAGNIYAGNPGAEFWGAQSGSVYDSKGQSTGIERPSMNFLIYWDGDLERELMSGNAISKINANKKVEYLLMADECGSCNSTKATPCLTADLFGDWREELVLRTNDNKYLRVYCTPYATDVRLTTLMQDSQYRAQVSTEQSGYNQPPHPSFYLGSDKGLPARPNVVINGGYEPESGTLIQVLNVQDGGNRYNWHIAENAQVGSTIFGDRDFTYTALPDALVGTEYIQTACDSKFSDNDLAVFTAAADMTVYVALDNRVENLPAWLADWTKTSMTAQTSNDVTMDVYSKKVTAGELMTLGTNGQSSYCVNYTVFASTAPEKIIGDVNADGQFTVADVVMMQKFLLNSGDLTDWTAGDLAADQVIDGFDLAIMKRMLLAK